MYSELLELDRLHAENCVPDNLEIRSEQTCAICYNWPSMHGDAMLPLTSIHVEDVVEFVGRNSVGRVVGGRLNKKSASRLPWRCGSAGISLFGPFKHGPDWSHQVTLSSW
jgi:hypothetical protein